MPTYEYACSSCSNEWEHEASMKDEPLKECPRCHAQTAKRQISRGAGFILKGGGWYSDLYSSAANKSGEPKPSDAKSTDAKSSDAKSSDAKSSDAKSSDAKSSETSAKPSGDSGSSSSGAAASGSGGSAGTGDRKSSTPA